MMAQNFKPIQTTDIIRIQMFYALSLAIALKTINTLALRQVHQRQEQTIHLEFFAFQFINLVQTIGIIVVLVAVGYACWRLRGCFEQRSSQTTVVAAPQRREQPPSPRIVTNQRQYKQTIEAPKIDYQSYKMKGQPKSNLTKQAPPSNPYVTQNQYQSQYKKWDLGDEFVSLAKQNQPCAICSQQSKEGERPRVVVSCSEDHCFHLSCLNEHRARVITFMGGNGLYKCPKCKDIYSANVSLYCNVCRKMKLKLNLSQMSDSTGNIKIDQLRNAYGDCCQNCRVI